MCLFHRWLALGLTCLILAGCSTTRQSEPEPVVTVPPVVPHVPVPVQVPVVVVPKVEAPKTNSPALEIEQVQVPSSPPAPVVAVDAQSAWVELEKWTAATGLASLRQTASGSMPSFALHSARGTLDFTAKSQIAHWNGVAFMLGFAPQVANGRPYVHSLDVHNSFLPLLNERGVHSHTNRILVIDPGHGGDQPGTKSVSGLHYEKEFTLDWARRLQQLLTNGEWTVFLTRSTDIDVALTNRVAFADHVHADLFVSLHFNSIPSAEQFGLETYCQTPAGMPSNLVRGPEDREPQVNNAFDSENFCWAMKMQRQLTRTTQAADRGVRRARFIAVLRNQNRPSVLIEGGYLSNHKEADLIASSAYRQKLAEGVAHALLNP